MQDKKKEQKTEKYKNEGGANFPNCVARAANPVSFILAANSPFFTGTNKVVNHQREWKKTSRARTFLI